MKYLLIRDVRELIKFGFDVVTCIEAMDYSTFWKCSQQFWKEVFFLIIDILI